MTIALLEEAANVLGPELLDRMAFVGAAALSLWITEEGAPPPRATRDVDLIVELGTLADYYRLGEELREKALVENENAHQLCAWRHPATGLELDVLPTDEEILGFSNRWHSRALRASVRMRLPSGTPIRAVPPPYLLATKLDAFASRGLDSSGEPDFLGSRDFGDVVALVDGRAELVEEVQSADSTLRGFIAERINSLARDFRFEGGVAGALLPDAASQARNLVIAERIQKLRDSGTSDARH